MEKYILIVEDDIDILEMIEYLLRVRGLNVYGVTSAKKFWERMGTHLPDVILMDIMLPDGNGIDMCIQLKSRETTKHIPVLLMSANMNQKEVEFRTTAQDYISKPFDVNEFVAKIKKHIA